MKRPVEVILGACALLLVAVASPARAEPAATVKAAAGVDKREPVGEATTFRSGGTVFVWSEVTGAAGSEVTHVWRRDGKEFRRARFQAGSRRWRLDSRMPHAAPGVYVVEVLAGDKKVGEVQFTVE